MSPVLRNVSRSPAREERSIGELFSELAAETSTLVRQEVALATAEMTAKATYAGKQAAVIAVGAVLAAVSFMTLVGAAVLALGMLIPLWASALLVGTAVGVAAIVTIGKGLTALKRIDPTPERTLLSLRQNKSWVKEQVQ